MPALPIDDSASDAEVRGDVIVVRGARAHNLKNIDVDIPRNALVVITGVSGSGKSSLAFDTLYAEGQRRYTESLNTYARQFLGVSEKPDVDRIDGLSPAIAIDQKTTSNNPRSTVGTITEIHDYLRLLYARVGVPECPRCHVELASGDTDSYIDATLTSHEGRVYVLSPVVVGKKGQHLDTLGDLESAGYSRVRIDGTVCALPVQEPLSKNKRHTIDVVVDRIFLRDTPGVRRRLSESIETAAALSGAAVLIEAEDGSWQSRVVERNSCPMCLEGYPSLEPRTFSFNSPYGACETCDGIGVVLTGDERLFIPDPTLPIASAIACYRGTSWSAKYQRRALEELLRAEGVDSAVSWQDAEERLKDLVLNGSDVVYRRGKWSVRYGGIIPWLEDRRREVSSDAGRDSVEKWMRSTTCPTCAGGRLNVYAAAVRVGGVGIVEAEQMSLEVLRGWVRGLSFSPEREAIARRILREISQRIEFLLNVGLPYLSLNRPSHTLSGGEAQRIRLASQVGSGLTGVMYVLDEPSIGLHARDNERLLTSLRGLRDLGNSVIVVEHDDETIRAADWVIDIGPGAGEQGGTVVAVGTAEAISEQSSSLTGDYLSGRVSIPVPQQRRQPTGHVRIVGARENNLCNIDVAIPLGCMVAITGASGSGKSTLVGDIIRPHLRNVLHGTHLPVGNHERIEGLDAIDKVVDIDQTPIGRTPRSNPATYTGVFDKVRSLYAETEAARERGWRAGRFSFNVPGGRCEVCEGDGVLRIEMHFLPDVYVPCHTCRGTRYRTDTLDVVFNDRTIADVLSMSVDEARDHFSSQPTIRRTLDILHDVGLGYIRLGQSATHLSGGEAQRIKLAEQLQKRSTGRTMYLLDEPTTGLHMDDIRKLVDVLDRLVDAGNTVVVIEHNLDVIAHADWVVDLGPDGGTGGGRIVGEGTPEYISQLPGSWTGRALQQHGRV